MEGKEIETENTSENKTNERKEEETNEEYNNDFLTINTKKTNFFTNNFKKLQTKVKMCCGGEKKTPGRNRIAKWMYCSYRPFIRCFFPWELIDFFIVFFFFAFNAFLFYQFGGFSHISSSKTIGKITGKMIHYSFLILLLPITRNGIFQWIFGSSWERIIVLHKWFARWAVILMIIHTILFIVYYTEKKHLKEFLELDIVAGEVAGALMILISFLSFPFFRRRFFQFFMKAHYLFFILIIIFVSLHKHGSEFIKIISLAIILYIIDEIIRFFNIARFGGQVTKIDQISDKFLYMEIKMKKRRIGGNFSYYSSQWANLYLPFTSFISLHPFSFASSPLVDFDRVHFLIKKEKGWTNHLFRSISKVLDMEDSINGDGEVDKKNNNKMKMIKRIIPTIRLDGGYGSLTNGAPRRYGVQMMISGGVGVSPNISLFKSLLYENSLLPLAEKSKIIFVWTSRSQSLFNFFLPLFLPSFPSFGNSPAFDYHQSKRSFISYFVGSKSKSDLFSDHLSNMESGIANNGDNSPDWNGFSLNGDEEMRKRSEKRRGICDEEEEDERGDDERRFQRYSLLFDELYHHRDLYDIRLFLTSSSDDPSSSEPFLSSSSSSLFLSPSSPYISPSSPYISPSDPIDPPPIKEMNEEKEMSVFGIEKEENNKEEEGYIREGRPDLGSIFKEVSQIAKKQKKNAKGKRNSSKYGKVFVFACGPSSLIRQSLRLSSLHSSLSVRFDVHHERFAI